MASSYQRAIGYLQLAKDPAIVKRAFRTSVIVGILLNIINNPEIIFSFTFDKLNLIKVLLTFLVPYLVSTTSSVAAQRKSAE
jgi:hypothetical protein